MKIYNVICCGKTGVYKLKDNGIQLYLTFIQHLSCGSYCFKSFTYIKSYYTHNNTAKQKYYPYFTGNKIDIERFTNSLKVRHLGSGRTRMVRLRVWCFHHVARAVISPAMGDPPYTLPGVNGGNPQRGTPPLIPNHEFPAGTMLRLS